MCLGAVEEPPVLPVLQQQVGVDEQDRGVVQAGAVLLKFTRLVFEQITLISINTSWCLGPSLDSVEVSVNATFFTFLR